MTTANRAARRAGARTDRPAASTAGSLAPIHWLLGVQSVVVILVSINRLSTLTLSYVAANEFLRWVDLINMIVLPVASLIGFYLLKRHLELTLGGAARDGRWHLALNLIFIVGVYLLAASYGDHEVTNYLHARFCPDGGPALASPDLCRIIIFNDDEFGHWLFFTGFVMMNAAIMFLQVLFPYKGRVGRGDWALLALNGLFIGAGIFANLAFEVIGLDLYVVALLALIAAGLLWRYRGQPLLIYYTVAYWLGLVGTLVYKLVRG
jgi:hypothetical protein